MSLHQGICSKITSPTTVLVRIYSNVHKMFSLMGLFTQFVLSQKRWGGTNISGIVYIMWPCSPQKANKKNYNLHFILKSSFRPAGVIVLSVGIQNYSLWESSFCRLPPCGWKSYIFKSSEMQGGREVLCLFSWQSGCGRLHFPSTNDCFTFWRACR